MFASFSELFVRRRGAARLAAATVVSGLVAAGGLAGARQASAADETARSQGGATATIAGLKTYGTAVIHGGAGDQHVSAGLFEMSVEGGGMLQTYCVDLHNPTQRDAKYHETPWSGTSLGTNKDAGKIRWILQNSYPQVNDLAALARKAGVRGVLTEQDAASGTQVAIWRYSDDVAVDALDPQAEQLADYLEKSARNLPEPRASLTLDPSAVSGRPGERLGPVTVRTNAGSATVTPPADAATSGVRIVDKQGKPVTSTTDGGQVFFEVPEDAAAGTAELTVQASTTVPVGRAFASESRSQTQILAGSSESTVSATAGATWAKQGPIPALTAAKNCAEGGVDIIASNKGDEPFTFELAGLEHTVAAGETRTVTVPLQEDQAYDFTIHGPGGFEKRFTGMLDCRIQGPETGTTTQTLSEPTPVAPGGSATDTNLAETGGSGVTPLIAGIAIGLVVIGGATLVVLRRREPAAGD
ncbi:Cys-Gln thioester bond-forming surface protein [Streptomyces lomondensis]|uniref:TQXA domain-containing protein n=1 Tax=Streptomyces lomondensis TaxID=68229 RepID=A0ABQ2WWW6_9ACTN|nr:Cys-Gln thioester bond-forming surface protein [Streptomyces lomondensis]MCF0083158.1 Cys-Gln thioester bond-forming surface protein [Streptomyces lomondensis]GGW79675.1 TQXA domain-containing protein [Streptomyces lomondensis]